MGEGEGIGLGEGLGVGERGLAGGRGWGRGGDIKVVSKSEKMSFFVCIFFF